MNRRWTAVAAAFAVATAGAAPAQAEPPVIASVYRDGVAAGDYGRAQLGAPDATTAGSSVGYAIRSEPNGPTQPTDAQTGWSVRAILQAAGASGAKSVDVMGLGGQGNVYTLSGGDLDAPSDFQDGLLPMLYANGDTMQSLRPLRNDADVNGGTQLAGPIRIYAHSGAPAPLSVTVSDAGDRTKRFQSSGSCGTVSWELGDGSTDTGAVVTHTYATTGTYTVVADAECGEQGGGAWTAVIGVGSPGPGATPGPGTTATPQPSATAKPTKTPKPKAKAKRTPTPTPTATPANRRGNGGGPAATATPAPSATAAPSSTPAPTATATPAATGPAPRGTPAPPAPPRSTLPTVTGRLISAVVPVSPASLAPAAAAAQTAGGAPLKPAPKLALPLGLLAVAALGLAGAWREWRRR